MEVQIAEVWPAKRRPGKTPESTTVVHQNTPLPVWPCSVLQWSFPGLRSWRRAVYHAPCGVEKQGIRELWKISDCDRIKLLCGYRVRDRTRAPLPGPRGQSGSDWPQSASYRAKR